MEKLSHDKIKWLKSLQDRKQRQLERLFVIEGRKMLEEVEPSDVLTLVVTSELSHILIEFPDALCYTASPKDMERISSLKNPPGIFAVIKMPTQNIDFSEPSILLDQIQDPGNLGTIIRIADWFGIKQIIASKNTVDLYNPKAIQASMGSLNRVSFFFEDLPMVIQSTTHPIYAACMDGESLGDIPEKASILLGNETHGIDPELMSLINHHITIPSFGQAESLNVSIACGIICARWKIK